MALDMLAPNLAAALVEKDFKDMRLDSFVIEKMDSVELIHGLLLEGKVSGDKKALFKSMIGSRATSTRSWN